MWDLIVSDPDHCLSFYFSRYKTQDFVYLTMKCRSLTQIHFFSGKSLHYMDPVFQL